MSGAAHGPPPRSRPRPSGRRVPFGTVVLVLALLVALLAVARWPRGGDAGALSPSAGARTTLGEGARGADAGASGGTAPGAHPLAGTPPPPCGFGDRPALAAGYGDWARTLVDIQYRVPASYAPPDLVSTVQAGFSALNVLRAFVVPDLSGLREAAAGAGHPIDLIVGYRSFEQQRELFDRRVRELGRPAALRRIALPGHSEHQLGTAFDFTSAGEKDVTQAWGDTPTGEWMAANAWRFGFVMSYPRGRESVTCFTYEPWHFRYVGRDRAARIRSSGLTLREYLWRELRAGGTSRS